MANEKVLVDVVFNPDTKQLEKRTQEISKDNKIKISFDKPDVKELEGPFKELQEKAMAMANGGFGRGLQQLKEGAMEFGSILKGGGDTSTALAGGLAKIGMEGATVFAGVAAGAAAGGAALVALYDRGTQLDNGFKALGISARAYTDALDGVINMEQAFAFRNAARNAGVQVSATQLARLSNFTAKYGQTLGDQAEAQRLNTAAANGDKEAMYQLGISYSETDTQAQRAARSIEVLTERAKRLGPAATTFGEDVAKFFGGIANSIGLQLTDARDEYRNLFRTESERQELLRQASAQRAQERADQARSARDSENRDALQRMALDQQRRANDLAGDAARIARNGLTTQEQLTQSQAESANIARQIREIRAMDGGSEQARLDRATRIAALQQQEAAQIQRRNQLQSFSVKLADAQRARLVNIAVAQAFGVTSGTRQLSLAEQIKMAEVERAKIAIAIVAAGGKVTDTQARQLEQLQNSINQGRQQQAQTASQAAATRRQNAQTELQLRLDNEMARARGEVYRTDIDALDVSQRRTQVERALTGLLAYRGATASQEASRLENINRFLQQRQTLESIITAQSAAYNAARNRAQTESSARMVAEASSLDRATQAMQGQLTLWAQQVAYANELQARRAQGQVLNSYELEYLQRVGNLQSQNSQILQLSRQREIELEAQLRAATDPAERLRLETALNEQRRQTIDLQRQQAEQARALSPMNSRLGKTLEGLAGGYADFGDAVQGLAGGAMQQFSSAFSTLISTAIEGKVSFGEAMLAMTKSMLTALSQQALVQGLFQLATGFARSAVGDEKGAIEAFTSAALFGAVGVAAGVGAGAIPTPETGKGSSAGPSDGGASGNMGSGASQRSSGPVIININTNNLLSSKEDTEKMVATALYGYENRIGRDTRSTRR